MALEPGLHGNTEATVIEADTAAALGSGDVAVLGTPRVVALVEAATVAALTGRLAAEQTSVGMRIELDHLRPSLVGERVRARAVLTAVTGSRLRFEVEAEGEGGVVARGHVTRAVVDRARFPPAAGPVAGEHRLRDLPGLGPASERMLRAGGVTSPEDLERLGAVEAYRRVLDSDSTGARPSLNLLWALEGALLDLDWRDLPDQRKAELLAQLDS